MRDLTIQDVIDKRMVHPLGGYQSRFEVGEYEVSIVGGRHGLYGDFETTVDGYNQLNSLSFLFLKNKWWNLNYPFSPKGGIIPPFFYIYM